MTFFISGLAVLVDGTIRVLDIGMVVTAADIAVEVAAETTLTITVPTMVVVPQARVLSALAVKKSSQQNQR